jgi:hypothetical protein
LFLLHERFDYEAMKKGENAREGTNPHKRKAWEAG